MSERGQEREVIPSYRRVLDDVDRKIHRIPLDLSKGHYHQLARPVSLWWFGYFVISLCAVLIVGRLPLIGLPLDLLAPPLRYVLLPAAVAVLVQNFHPDGRPGHVYLLRRVQMEYRRAMWYWQHRTRRWGGTLPTRWDQHADRLRKCRISGPADVRFREPVRMVLIGKGWKAKPDGDVREYDVPDGKRLEVRP